MIAACTDSNLWSALGIILGAAIAFAGYSIGRRS